MSSFVNPDYIGRGTGISSWQRAVVVDFNDETHMAVCQTANGLLEVTILLLPAKVAPLLGEKWIIERKFGTWVFSYHIVDLTT